MEWAGGWLAARVVSVDAHFVRLFAQTDSDQAWLHFFIKGTANGCREIGFDCPLKWQFPGDEILIDSSQFATFDHVAAGY